MTQGNPTALRSKVLLEKRPVWTILVPGAIEMNGSCPSVAAYAAPIHIRGASTGEDPGQSIG